MNDHSGRRSQDTVHHHRGRELSSVDRVPNTSPDESRAGLLQVGREETRAGLQGGQGSTLHTAQPLCCLQPRHTGLVNPQLACLANQQAGKEKPQLHSQGWQAVLRWAGEVFALPRHDKCCPCDLRNSSALALATNLSNQSWMLQAASPVAPISPWL